MNTIKTLNQSEFNKEFNLIKIDLKIKEVKEKIKVLNECSEKLKIYIQIDERREIEKGLKVVYPFLYNDSHFNAYYQPKDNINQIKKAYECRQQTFLNCIGFKSINEKTKTIKCNYSYSLGLYKINYITNLNLNGDDKDYINIVKKYQNGNVEFTFKSEYSFIYDILREIIYYNNKCTNYVINNITPKILKEYKETKKKPYLNETQILYRMLPENLKRNGERLNINLINKVLK